MANYKRYQKKSTETDYLRGWMYFFTSVFLVILMSYKIKVYGIVTKDAFSVDFIRYSISFLFALALEGSKIMCLVMAINDARRGNVTNVRIGYAITLCVMMIDVTEAIHFNGQLGAVENNAIFMVSAVIVTMMEIRISRYYVPDKAVTISVTDHNEMVRNAHDKELKINQLKNELAVMNQTAERLNNRCVTAEGELEALREKSNKPKRNGNRNGNGKSDEDVTDSALRQRRYRLRKKKDKKEEALRLALKNERYEDVTAIQAEIEEIDKDIERT